MYVPSDRSTTSRQFRPWANSAMALDIVLRSGKTDRVRPLDFLAPLCEMKFTPTDVIKNSWSLMTYDGDVKTSILGPMATATIGCDRVLLAENESNVIGQHVYSTDY